MDVLLLGFVSTEDLILELKSRFEKGNRPNYGQQLKALRDSLTDDELRHKSADDASRIL